MQVWFILVLPIPKTPIVGGTIKAFELKKEKENIGFTYTKNTNRGWNNQGI